MTAGQLGYYASSGHSRSPLSSFFAPSLAVIPEFTGRQEGIYI